MASTKASPISAHQEQGLVHLTQLKGALGQRKRLISLSAAVVLITAGGMAWRFSPQQRLGRDLSNYTVETERGTLPGIVSANGELQAKRSVNVSPKKAGLLKELYVDQGDEVKKGEVLARMDSGDYNDRCATTSTNKEPSQPTTRANIAAST